MRMTVRERFFGATIVYLMYWSGCKPIGVGALPSKLSGADRRALIGDGVHTSHYNFPEPCNQGQIDLLGHLESMIHWVEGPFVNDIEYIGLKDCSAVGMDGGLVRLYDSSSNPQQYVTLPNEIVTNPVNLRGFIDNRHQLSVTFSLSSDAPEPVELRWVHFRGNLKLVPLGSGSERDGALVIHPGQSVRQYTRGGHMFVAMKLGPQLTDAKQGVGGHPEFSALEHQIQRVVGMYMMPAMHQNCLVGEECAFAIYIRPGGSALYHTHQLFDGTVCAHSRHSQLDIAFDHSPNTNITACFRELLMKYWEHQRLSQVYVNTWAVPSIPLAELQSGPIHAVMGVAGHLERTLASDTGLLWTVFNVDAALAASLSEYHQTHRTSPASVPEPPISLVFNQLEVLTYYVPLPTQLLDEVIEEVRRAAAAWLGMLPEDLLLTGAYGSREYRKDAVVRWHVDPVHSQPITAILHLAEKYVSSVNDASHACLSEQGSDAECARASGNSWSIQIPKSIATYRNYSSDKHPTCSDEVHNIDLRVGQVLLLQSAKLPHARVAPFPGEWYANAFVHFAPVGWADRQDVQMLS